MLGGKFVSPQEFVMFSVFRPKKFTYRSQLSFLVPDFQIIIFHFEKSGPKKWHNVAQRVNDDD